MIFTSDGDFLLFRRVLDEACREREVALHSYVMMPNHIHLLMTPRGEWDISWAMQCAVGRYVKYFNRRYGRTGTLWEGRFFAAVIGDDRYLVACHRYIDCNPVRAGIVAKPEDYMWSSHRHYTREEGDSMLSTHGTILGFGADAPTRRAAYRMLFMTSQDPGELDAIRHATRHGRKLSASYVIGRPSRPRKTTSDTNECRSDTNDSPTGPGKAPRAIRPSESRAA